MSPTGGGCSHSTSGQNGLATVRPTKLNNLHTTLPSSAESSHLPTEMTTSSFSDFDSNFEKTYEKIINVAKQAAENVVTNALGLNTSHFIVNEEMPVVLLDQFLLTIGVGRQSGLFYLVKNGYIRMIENDNARSLLKFTKQGFRGIYAPTPEYRHVFKLGGQMPQAGVGRNTHKLLVTVPEGVNFLSLEVFTPEVRAQLYKEQWGSQLPENFYELMN